MGAFDELFKEEFDKIKAEADQFMTAQQIYDNFDKARGTGSLQDARNTLQKVEEQYTIREHDITKLAASMEEGWAGAASGAAQRGAGPMAVEHGHAAQALATAKDLLQNQSDTFHDTKSRVVQIPPYPDQDQTFRDMLSGDQDTALAKITSYHSALGGNVKAMDDWTTSSNHNAGMMPGSYGSIDPHALDVSTGPATGGGGGKKPGEPGGGGGAKKPGGGSPVLPPRHGPGAEGGGGTAGGGPGRGIAEPPGWGQPGTEGGNRGPSGKGIGDSGDTGNHLPDDSTTPGSYDPASFRPGTSDPSVGGWRPGAVGALGGLGPGSGGGDSASTGSVFVTAEPGGPGGPDAGALAGGKATGGAVGGAQGARAGGAAAPGAKGAAGGGQGMMGAGGGKGKSEDEEHKRKYGIEEDSIFDDGDEKEVDPRTGWAPTQPVIGQ
ncbi:hypothetical protein [Amycolatopsis minnesotensis]|uniref:PPE family protein n=1 Tax=Amycolatopsis minnesotensis TaxID=337894 RepID=A0ABP5D337_9PSEU